MSNQPNPQLAKVAKMRGAGVRMAFAFDTKSLPGQVIVHQVQLHTFTMPLDESFDPIKFQVIHDDNDPRLIILADSFKQQ